MWHTYLYFPLFFIGYDDTIGETDYYINMTCSRVKHFFFSSTGRSAASQASVVPIHYVHMRGLPYEATAEDIVKVNVSNISTIELKQMPFMLKDLLYSECKYVSV